MERLLAVRFDALSDTSVATLCKTRPLAATVPPNVKSQGGRGDIARTLGVCECFLDDRDDTLTTGLKNQ